MNNAFEQTTSNLNRLADKVVKLTDEKILLEQQLNQLEKLSRKLYGTVLHVYALAKEDPVVVVGPELYKEAAEGAKEYEEYNAHS